MPTLLENASTQYRVWSAARSCGSPDPSKHAVALEALKREGEASVGALTRALSSDNPRARYGAATVLHSLGKPAGLTALLGAMRAGVRAEHAGELETAFIAIGSPVGAVSLI